ncbi:predicted protein [Coccidioides posadasii str. Silveira]|uniref:Predicted protein n=1 Tax=Coccidioides posadasii (strain RMSCC 757 / Silveira) TaxID=443226 RepID=E9CVG2_COCPS|nr:predicted protein [Coccidioides posadasii str. Silveira]
MVVALQASTTLTEACRTRVEFHKLASVASALIGFRGALIGLHSETPLNLH